jgi:hypothetical protein
MFLKPFVLLPSVLAFVLVPVAALAPHLRRKSRMMNLDSRIVTGG